jgi:uncharacterized protein
VLAKPTGAACNLGCSYCFFLDEELLYPGQPLRMSDEVLETYLTQLVAAHETPDVDVAWQGGEPTLMGLEFFRRAARIQARLAVDGVRFHNTIQTPAGAPGRDERADHGQRGQRRVPAGRLPVPP